MNAKINVKSYQTISGVESKFNETCKNYFEIEHLKNAKISYSLNEFHEGPIWVLRCFYLTIWWLIWIGKTAAEHDDGL